MKCILCHSECDGGVTRVLCFGKDENELNDDINLTMKRLNWDKRFCSIERR